MTMEYDERQGGEENYKYERREGNHEELFVIQSRKENRKVFIFSPIFISHPLCQLLVYFELHLCLFTIIPHTIGQTRREKQ